MTAGEMCRELGEAAWAWVLRQVRDDDGPWLPEVVPDGEQPEAPGEDRDWVYAGIGGLALVLAEISQSRALSGPERALAARITDRLCATAPVRADPSLYTGLAGDVTALKLLAPGSERVALRRLAALATPAGWNIALDITAGSPTPAADLVLGTAGVILAAIWAGPAPYHPHRPGGPATPALAAGQTHPALHAGGGARVVRGPPCCRPESACASSAQISAGAPDGRGPRNGGPPPSGLTLRLRSCRRR